MAIGEPATIDFATLYPGWRPRWRLRTRSLQFGVIPRLMGIVNVTPDSFSDGGRFFDPSAAIDQGLELADDGADILDIGGESTRPYSEPITADEELRRVMPVIEALAAKTSLPISIDTSKSQVAAEAIAAGAEIVNDVTGLSGDPRMAPLAAGTDVAVCVMHMRGTPQTMQDDPRYGDVVHEIHQYLAERRDAMLAAGIDRERICLDPGIGFGKTHEHNLALMAGCHTFHDLECPLLAGHSRKGFLGKLVRDRLAGRDYVTAGAAVALALQGVQIVRVHNVRAVREALLGFFAGGGFNQR
ncbi:MAG: dihydropteroate synthase [Pirellulales bacterium]